MAIAMLIKNLLAAQRRRSRGRDRGQKGRSLELVMGYQATRPLGDSRRRHAADLGVSVVLPGGEDLLEILEAELARRRSYCPFSTSQKIILQGARANIRLQAIL
jgi:hypothetical protein